MTTLSAILIDDEADIRELLAISLSRLGYECYQAGSFSEGKNLIEATKCDLCITDVRMPDGSGIDIVRHFKTLHPTIPIAVMTAFDTTDIAIEAMKAGAFDFLAKPIRAARLESLVKDARRINANPAPTNSNASASPLNTTTPSVVATNILTGISPEISALRDQAKQAACSMAPVQIVGEAGSGKTQLARFIHEQSKRGDGPFEIINCEDYGEDELSTAFFGVSSGAKVIQGAFAAAQHGILVLKNPHSLPIEIQRTVLRCLKDRRFMPLGGDKKLPIEFRLISTTPTNSDVAVAEGKLHRGFFDYLSVIKMETTPLRERPQDIEPLLTSFIEKEYPDTPLRFEPSVLQELREYPWPQNIDELKNILMASAKNAEDSLIGLDDIRNKLHSNTTDNKILGVTDPLGIADLEGFLTEVEDKIIRAVLKEEKWHRVRAAKRLGLTTRQFRYKLVKLGLTKEE